MVPIAVLLLQQEVRSQLETAWSLLDKKREGFITHELFVDPRTGNVDSLWAQFGTSDTNSDGKVDSAEFVALFVRHALQTMSAEPQAQGLTELQALQASVAVVNRRVELSIQQLATAMRAKGAVGWVSI